MCLTKYSWRWRIGSGELIGGAPSPHPQKTDGMGLCFSVSAQGHWAEARATGHLGKKAGAELRLRGTGWI